MLPQWKIFLYKLLLPLGMADTSEQPDFTTLLHAHGSKGIEYLGGHFHTLGGQYHFDQNFNLTLCAGLDSIKKPGIVFAKAKGMYVVYPYKQRLFVHGLFGGLGKVNLNMNDLRPIVQVLIGPQAEFYYSAYLSFCFEYLFLFAILPLALQKPDRLWQAGIKFNF